MAVRFLGLLVQFAGATATAYLALLVARLVCDAPRLLLTWISDAELLFVATVAAVPRFFFLQPSGGAFPIDELYLAGPVAAALSLILAATAMCWRRPGLQVAGAFVAFWLTVWLSGAGFQYFERSSGPIADAASVMPAFLMSTAPGRWAFGGAVCLLGLFGLILAWARVSRHIAPSRRFGAVALLLAGPVVALGALIPELRLEEGWIGWRGFSDAPLFFAGLAGLFALATPSRGEPDVRLSGPVALATGLVALGAYFSIDSLANPAEQATTKAEAIVSEHWSLRFEEGLLSADEQQGWASAADRRLEEYAARLGVAPPPNPIEAYIAASPPERRRGGRGRGPRQPPPGTNRIIAAGQAPADPRGEVLLLMRSAWGEPESAAIAGGIARYVVGDFFGHDLTQYARRLALEERPYNLAEALDMPGEYLSPLVRDALAGAWVASVADQLELRELYQSPLHALPRRLDCRAEDLETRWGQWLTTPDELTTAPPPAPPAYQKGISFSSEFGGRWAYGSQIAAAQLPRIRETGANSVAIVPYAFTLAPEDTRIRIRGDEPVDRTARTIRQAKQAGLAVTLKPHLWSNRFTGDIEFRDPERFRRWFAIYSRWILHFARMAQLEGAEMFVIGNELGGLTSFEDDWRGLIRDVRKVYSGPVTYASHWREEFEQVAFWDELDFIGVNFYFPLARLGETPRADSEKVQEIASRLEAVSAKFGKKVLFTEVGFPSLALAAAEPWRDEGSSLDLELQLDCYSALFEAFYEQPWLSGMYWWKWPSHGRGGRFDGRHNPIGKPALEELKRWYRASR